MSVQVEFYPFSECLELLIQLKKGEETGVRGKKKKKPLQPSCNQMIEREMNNLFCFTANFKFDITLRGSGPLYKV